MLRAILFVVIAVALYGGAAIVAYTIESLQCQATAAEMDVPYKYGLFTGCLVKVEGKYVPLKNYRVM